jgi:hypothetical protein
MRTTDVVATFAGSSYFTLVADGRPTATAELADGAAPDAGILKSEPSRG